METPFKVTIVVPCYNYAKYLPDCIESLFSQTYPIHEIIIVSDGSPDNAGEVANELIKKYPTDNIIYLEKENGGLSSARNAGIQRATGDWLMCLDADDKLVPGAIEEHVGLITDDLTIAQCGLMEFGNRHMVMTPANPTSIQKVLRGNTIYCNAMFNKKVWEAVGGYDESETLRWGWEDYEFWIRCLAYGCHVKTSDFIALRYRVHDSNMTAKTTHPHWADLRKYIGEKHKDLYEKFDIPIPE